jgi:hypothetical protein
MAPEVPAGGYWVGDYEASTKELIDRGDSVVVILYERAACRTAT